MAPKTILALAVGDPKHSQRIDHPGKLPEVRPYISGLIHGLAALKCELGTDFVIDYKQNWLDHMAKGHAFADMPKHPALIYAMSTKVMRAAGEHTKEIPIVFPNCSEFGDERFVKAGRATGFSARRTQTAGDCFDRFFMAVPTLKQVLILHINEHDISENALALVKAAASKKGVESKPILVRSHPDLLEQLGKLPAKSGRNRDRRRACPAGGSVLRGDARDHQRGPGGKEASRLLPDDGLGAGRLRRCLWGIWGYAIQVRRTHRRARPSDPPRRPRLQASHHDGGARIRDFEWAVSKSAGKALGIPTPEAAGLRVI